VAGKGRFAVVRGEGAAEVGATHGPQHGGARRSEAVRWSAGGRWVRLLLLLRVLEESLARNDGSSDCGREAEAKTLGGVNGRLGGRRGGRRRGRIRAKEK